LWNRTDETFYESYTDATLGSKPPARSQKIANMRCVWLNVSVQRRETLLEMVFVSVKIDLIIRALSRPFSMWIARTDS
jgi:hypothetical protein